MKTMMQITPVKAAPQLAAADPATTKGSSDQFTPHLQKAVTEATQPTSETPAKELPHSSSQAFIDSTLLEAAGLLIDTPISNYTSPKTDQSEEKRFGPLELVSDENEFSVSTAEQKLTIQPTEQNLKLQAAAEHISLHVQTKEVPAPAIGKELSLLSGEKTGTATLNHATVSPLSIQKTDVSNFSLPSSYTLSQTLKVDLNGVQPHNTRSEVPGIGQNQTLLQQLQQIIESGNETGTLTIEATASSYSFQYRGAGGAKLGDIASSQLHQPGGTGEKNGPKIPALRQDLLAQYFDAKLSSNEKGDPTQNPQTNDPQNQSHSQQASGSQQQHPSVLPDQANSFQNISSALQDIQTNQSQSITRQVTLPSGTVVDEDNVIQQVAERFQINNRANDIKLNLKLHPAELGELKIDLTLKEGSIKGNVVVQSQQIQEIIEKNMLKLRSVLEDQGFTVEEIVVTSESESVTDFELFEQHLSQQNELIPSFTDPQQENDFEGALEDAVVQSVESSTGVNIKA